MGKTSGAERLLPVELTTSGGRIRAPGEADACRARIDLVVCSIVEQSDVMRPSPTAARQLVLVAAVLFGTTGTARAVGPRREAPFEARAPA
jgi:hypothetical protein